MNTSCKIPMTVALAEKFLWEVFLTEKWDHIFFGDENNRLPILPRQLSFCPTKRSWGKEEGVACSVTYIEPNIDSRVTVRMRYSREDEVLGLLWPDSISFDVSILNIPLRQQLGIEKLTTSKIKVRRK
jgi:hypothetical protein